jgi:hypothetical protein
VFHFSCEAAARSSPGVNRLVEVIQVFPRRKCGKKISERIFERANFYFNFPDASFFSPFQHRYRKFQKILEKNGMLAALAISIKYRRSYKRAIQAPTPVPNKNKTA